MAWINGQWVEDRPAFGGMLGGLRPEEELIYGGTFDAPGLRPDRDLMTRPGFPSLGGFGAQPRFAEGYTGDTSLDVIGGPMQPPPFGDRPGMPNLPPQMNPPGYSRGPQMQPPFGGGLGDITPWNPVQTPQYQPPWRPMDDLRGAGVNLGPQVRPPMPPPPPTIGDVWPQPEPPQVRPPMPPMPPPRPPVLPPDMIFDPPPPRTDHEFNVQQREKTKRRLAADRAKTKKHYAKLRAKGASPKTIAKAKAKSKARSAKIKGQSLRRGSTA